MIGVAFSERINGPYTRYEGGELIRGHAFAIWPYRDGLLLLSGLKHDIGKIYGDNWNDPTGIQYLYYSEDGLHFFTPVCKFPNRACGIYWPENPVLRNDLRNCWGVSVNTHDRHFKRYIQKFRFEFIDS